MKKIFLILIVLSSYITTANAGPSPTLDTTRSYQVYIKGIHIADLNAGIKEDSLTSDIDSYGIVKKISKYSSHGKSTFIFKNGEFIPQHYYTNFTQRHGPRTVDIKYNDKGEIISEVVTPPDHSWKRPTVNQANKKGAFDPLTAVMVARQKIINGLKNDQNSFNINIYDGRRLARLEFNILGREVRKIEGKKQNIVDVTFTRKPLEGFTNNELKRMKSEEPTFSLYLTDDEYMLPIKADVFSEMGTAVLVD
jgi:hypothetical protein